MANTIIIIGAGVIGAATALALQKDGHAVTLIDREAPCAGASFGNAGGIVNGSCTPTAMPGILFDSLRMMTRSDSPITIQPAYLHKILPWLLRFIWQSRTSAVNNNARDLHALSKTAVASWKQLVGQSELSALFRSSGWLKVYEHEKTFASSCKARELLDKLGTPYELLNKSQIHDLEPNLAPIFTRGIYQKDSMSVTNPGRLVKGMVKQFLDRGGVYTQFAVEQIEVRNNGINLKGQSGNLRANKIVIAAGAWSRSLTKQLGDKVALDTERGYHLMLPQSAEGLLSRPVHNQESSFVLCPMETGIRITAQVELAGLDIAPNFNNIRNLLPAAKRMLPGMDIREESAWMGFRPSLPDSLPVLGFSSTSRDVLYAFGHQHLGMTLAAISAQIIADLVADRKPPIAVSPYRPNRFTTL
ncbi:MAG: glycine/D-amino acid oxidase-like deaminating enzyme [Cryomorphaceae bacterium]|jgi:glycine/D-amino acid oxidase-like deaminating enzyme